jgi:hypothetical protein
MGKKDDKPDELEDRGAQPNAVDGVISITASVIILVIVVFVPSRQGAPASDKYYLVGLAIFLIGWGIRRIKLAKKKMRDGTKSTEKEDDR